MQENKFQIDFATPTFRDWEKNVQQELGNNLSWQNLIKEKAGLTIKPYYDSRDSVKERKIKIESFGGLISCQNVPKVIVTDNATANQEALTHLNTGADGIYFKIQANLTSREILLKDIEMLFCSLLFQEENDSSEFLNFFANFVNKKSEKEKISGAFFWKDFPSVDFDWAQFINWNNFKVGGICVAENKNIVDEIVDALCKAVETLDHLNKNGYTEMRAFQTLAFSISVGTDFFLSIAKIRALKNLWLTLQEAYQIKNPTMAFVHVDSRVWRHDDFQPHGNLIKQTFGAMAAILGGGNALSIEPEDPKNSMLARVARNVLSILKEESYFSKVNDPLAGAFYVDALTHQIAHEAWKKFQLRMG